MKVKKANSCSIFDNAGNSGFFRPKAKKNKKQKAEVVGKIITSKVYKINVGTCILPYKDPHIIE